MTPVTTATGLDERGLNTIRAASGEAVEQAIARGAYVLGDAAADPTLILAATGSEVAICVEAAAALNAEAVLTC